jgi:VanZ family protein
MKLVPSPHARYWLPVVLWMALIFVASGDSLSAPRIARILGPLLHWLFPGLSEEAIGLIVFAVRKAAHAMEYAVLGWLWWRALRRPVKRDPRPWDWRPARWALLLSTAYAATDELHQSFTASRTASGWDVLLDALGAAAGLLFLWRFGRWTEGGPGELG